MRRVGKSSWDSVNIHSLLSFRFSYRRQTRSLCEAVILQQELSACESCYEQLLLDSTWLELRLEPETSLIRFCAAAVTVWSRAERAGWIFWKHLIRRRLKLLWNFFSFRLWVLIFMCQETSPPQPAARLRQPAVAGARAETEAGGKRKKRDRINGNFVAWHQNAASSSPEDRKWEKCREQQWWRSTQYYTLLYWFYYGEGYKLIYAQILFSCSELDHTDVNYLNEFWSFSRSLVYVNGLISNLTEAAETETHRQTTNSY